MTYSDTQPRGTLRYRLLSASLLPATSSLSDPGSWGHEYVRHLAAELGEEYTDRAEETQEAAKALGTVEELHALAMQCATFLLGHNAEPDAVDLLEEMEIVDRIAELVDENTYGRVCAYMVRCVSRRPHGLACSPNRVVAVSIFSPRLTTSPSFAPLTKSTSSTRSTPKLWASPYA
jgi:26S proteasome regulatory subunit N1